MKNPPKIPIVKYHKILLLRGANPVPGKTGPPTSFDCPYIPIVQSLLAPTLTQMGTLAGRELIVVENPITSVLYNQSLSVGPY